jgi:hypothetical protein
VPPPTPASPPQAWGCGSRSSASSGRS